MKYWGITVGYRNDLQEIHVEILEHETYEKFAEMFSPRIRVIEEKHAFYMAISTFHIWTTDPKNVIKAFLQESDYFLSEYYYFKELYLLLLRYLMKLNFLFK